MNDSELTSTHYRLKNMGFVSTFHTPVMRGLQVIFLSLFVMIALVDNVSAQEKTLAAPVDQPRPAPEKPTKPQQTDQAPSDSKTPINQDTITELLQPKLVVDIQHLDYGNITGHSGSYDMRTTSVELSNLVFSFKYENYHFNWKEVGHLPFGDGVHAPFKEIQNITLYGRVPYRLSSSQLIYSGIGFSSAFEDNPSSTLTYEAFSFYSQDFSAKESWQIGGYFKHHPVEAMFLPIIEYTYNKANDTRSGIYGHLGFPISQIGYYLSSRWRTDFGAVYRNSVAKLAEDSPIANNGYSYYSSWRGEWAWYYLPVKQFEVKAALEYTLYRNLINYDAQYRKLGEYRVNNSLGMGLGIIYNF